jgi:[ribosomal protein S18]-alanine N-acetyltransferase
MLDKLFSKKTDFEIVAMEDIHCRPAALLHGERFQRAWSDGEFHELLGQEAVTAFVARQMGPATRDVIGGFVLARDAAGEAEILSIGVSGKFSRQGLGWRLMRAALQELRARDAETVFLEVDETNVAALALYKKLRFEKIAERPAYYAGADGKKNKAHVMRLDFVKGGKR